MHYKRKNTYEGPYRSLTGLVGSLLGDMRNACCSTCEKKLTAEINLFNRKTGTPVFLTKWFDKNDTRESDEMIEDESSSTKEENIFDPQFSLDLSKVWDDLFVICGDCAASVLLAALTNYNADDYVWPDNTLCSAFFNYKNLVVQYFAPPPISDETETEPGSEDEEIVAGDNEEPDEDSEMNEQYAAPANAQNTSSPFPDLRKQLLVLPAFTIAGQQLKAYNTIAFFRLNGRYFNYLGAEALRQTPSVTAVGNEADTEDLRLVYRQQAYQQAKKSVGQLQLASINGIPTELILGQHKQLKTVTGFLSTWNSVLAPLADTNPAIKELLDHNTPELPEVTGPVSKKKFPKYRPQPLNKEKSLILKERAKELLAKNQIETIANLQFIANIGDPESDDHYGGSMADLHETILQWAFELKATYLEVLNLILQAIPQPDVPPSEEADIDLPQAASVNRKRKEIEDSGTSWLETEETPEDTPPKNKKRRR